MDGGDRALCGVLEGTACKPKSGCLYLPSIVAGTLAKHGAGARGTCVQPVSSIGPKEHGDELKDASSLSESPYVR